MQSDPRPAPATRTGHVPVFSFGHASASPSAAARHLGRSGGRGQVLPGNLPARVIRAANVGRFRWAWGGAVAAICASKKAARLLTKTHVRGSPGRLLDGEAARLPSDVVSSRYSRSRELHRWRCWRRRFERRQIWGKMPLPRSTPGHRRGVPDEIAGIQAGIKSGFVGPTPYRTRG